VKPCPSCFGRRGSRKGQDFVERRTLGGKAIPARKNSHAGKTRNGPLPPAVSAGQTATPVSVVPTPLFFRCSPLVSDGRALGHPSAGAPPFRSPAARISCGKGGCRAAAQAKVKRRAKGMSRSRVPFCAKIALVRAGASGGGPVAQRALSSSPQQGRHLPLVDQSAFRYLDCRKGSGAEGVQIHRPHGRGPAGGTAPIGLRDGGRSCVGHLTARQSPHRRQP
jgi:hypothetical protein